MTISGHRRSQQTKTVLRSAAITSFTAITSMLISGVAVAAMTTTPYTPGPQEFDFHAMQEVDDAAGYVFLSGASGLEVRDLAGTIVSNTLTISDPYALALSADGATLYVADPDAHAIDVVNTATLTETSQIHTASSVSPTSLALIGSTLWFGYRNLSGGTAVPIGVVDLSQPVPVVSAPASITNPSGPAISWYAGPPVLATSAALPGTLFAAGTQISPGPIARFATNGSGLTVTAYASNGGSTAQQIAVSKDGTQLFEVSTSATVKRISTADLSPLGYVDERTWSDSVAIAPDDGRLALGQPIGNDPAVYTYDSSLNFVSQYSYREGWGAAPGGVAFSADGDTIYAVVQMPDSSSPQWNFELHVITGTHSAGPPAVSSLTAQPDFRSITLRWVWAGHFDPSTTATYVIERGTNPDQLTPYTTVPSNHMAFQTWTDADVQTGVTYYYKVAATNAAGTGDWSPLSAAVRNERVVVYVHSPGPYPTSGAVDLAYVTDGGPTHVITPSVGDYSDPAVSPGGTEVAYAAGDGGSRHLWVTSIDGTSTRELTADSSVDTQPSWSPDGSTVAFTRTVGATSSIWTVPASGGPAAGIPGTDGDSQPAWGPSGNVLAVTAGSGSDQHIALINTQGGYADPVVGTNGDLPQDRCFTDDHGASLCHYSGSAPSWSPDGTKLAYIQHNAGGMSLAVIPAVGGSIDFHLWHAFSAYTRIAWSPDGELVLSHGDSIIEEASDGTGSTILASTGSLDGTSDAGTASATAPGPMYQPLATPGPVSGITATPGYRTQTLTWNTDARTAYVVIRRSAPGGSAPSSPTDGLAVYSGPATTTTATDLESGTAYTFAIFPYSSLGDAGSMASLTATTNVPAPPAPPAPAPPAPTPSTPTRFDILTGPTASGHAMARVGKRIRVRPGTVSPAPTRVIYQWLRNGKIIKGATEPTYTLTSKDRKKKIQVRITTQGAGLTTLVQTITVVAKVP